MREAQSGSLRGFLHRAYGLRPGSAWESAFHLLPASGNVRPCFAVLGVLALPLQPVDVSARPGQDGSYWGSGTGCCLLRTGAAEGPADSTLESWLGTREKEPAPPPQAEAAPSRTTAIRTGSEAETDWRLIPFIAAQASGGIPGQPTLLSIAVTSPYGQPNPQHEAITYVLIDNLPPGTTLSGGDRIADDTWRVRLEELPGLSMTLPPETADSVTLHLTAVTDHGGGVIAKQARDLTIPILAASTETATADASATPEPGGTQPPAQGGSSQSIGGAALPDGTEPDPAASGRSAAGSTQESADGEAGPPAAVPAPAPAPVAEAPPDAPLERPVAAAVVPTPAPEPDVPPEAPVIAAAPPPAVPPPPEPPVSAPVAMVAVAALPPPAPERVPPPEVAAQRPARLPSAIPEAALMKRGDDLFAQGDLAGARLYYEMVAETGNAAAALALGRTHDPLIHERLRVRGLPPDPEQAAVWYRRATAAGSGDAEQQLQKLTVWLAGKSR